MLVNPKYAEPPLTVPLDAPTEVSAEAKNAQATIKLLHEIVRPCS